jgi:hypothetical protein
LSTFRIYQKRFKGIQSLQAMERTMRTVQRRTRTGSAGDARIDRCADCHENSDAGPAMPAPKRWVPHRKAEIVAAVRGGFLSLDDALKRYALSIEEYLAWQQGIELFGLAGLRVNRTQRRRQAGSPSTSR